mgnify:CR=1 FL=1
MHEFEMPQEIIDRVTARQGRVHCVEGLAPRETALVVVDMQNYFMKAGFQSAAAAAGGIVANVNRLADMLRALGGTVIWIQTEAGAEDEGAGKDGWWTLREKYAPERWQKRIDGLSNGGEGHALWAEMDVRPADEMVIKRRYSAFIHGSSNLEDVLRERGIDTILITGVATNVCCESTGRDAMMLGFRTLMVADGNATFDDDAHRASLIGFYSTFGDVQTTDEVMALLRGESGDVASAAE